MFAEGERRNDFCSRFDNTQSSDAQWLAVLVQLTDRNSGTPDSATLEHRLEEANMAGSDAEARTPEGDGVVDEQTQSSTMSFTGDFSAQLAALIAGGVSKEEMESISALPSGSALLIVRRGSNVGARFLLDTDLQVAGRHPNAEIFLDDVTVSRRHAEFTRHGREFHMRDLGSLNGTYYNGERINSAVLTNGGEVQVGKFRLTFYSSPLDTSLTSASAGN